MATLRRTVKVKTMRGTGRHLHPKRRVVVTLYGLRREKKRPRGNHHHKTDDEPALGILRKLRNRLAPQSKTEETQVNHQDGSTYHG